VAQARNANNRSKISVGTTHNCGDRLSQERLPALRWQLGSAVQRYRTAEMGAMAHLSALSSIDRGSVEIIPL
jgi:hypothetical protein